MSFVIRAIVAPDVPAATQDQSEEDERRLAERLAQEIAKVRATAEAEGRQSGEAVARQAIEDRLAAQEQSVAAAVAALAEAAGQLTDPLARREEELARLTLELAFRLARHIAGTEVHLRQDSLEGLVRRLLAEAAAERKTGQSIILRLNPEDLSFLAGRMASDGVHLLADAAVSRGGALVELSAPDGDPIDRVEWDARMDTRIKAIGEALFADAGSKVDPAAGRALP